MKQEFENIASAKGVWLWQKEWWWVIAINEVIARKTKGNPNDTVSFSISEVNNMLDELGDTLLKRLRVFATFPLHVSLKGPENIEITPT